MAQTLEQKLKGLELTPKKLFNQILEGIQGFTRNSLDDYLSFKDEGNWVMSLSIDLRKIDLTQALGNLFFHEENKFKGVHSDEKKTRFDFLPININEKIFYVDIEFDRGTWDIPIKFITDGEILVEENTPVYKRYFKLMPYDNLKYDIKFSTDGFVRQDYPQFTNEEWKSIISSENMVKFKFENEN